MAAARAGQACSEWGTACGDTCAEFKVGDPENACESSCCDGTSCTPNRGDGKFFCRPSEDGDGVADGALLPCPVVVAPTSVDGDSGRCMRGMHGELCIAGTPQPQWGGG